MRTKLVALCIGAMLLAAACGGGNGDGPAGDADATPERTTRANASPVPTGPTPDVERADEGEVNTPKPGTYVYDYKSELLNRSTPNATPSQSKPDAESRMEISVDGDVVSVTTTTTENEAQSTVRRRYEDDQIVELSVETRSDQGQRGCEFSPPVQFVPIPIEEGETGPVDLEGEGTGCDGERMVTIGERENIADAEGRTWSTWKITVETIVRSSQGLSNRSTDTRWFSPDLGHDIRVEGAVEVTNAEGAVVARAQSSNVLKSYPE